MKRKKKFTNQTVVEAVSALIQVIALCAVLALVFLVEDNEAPEVTYSASTHARPVHPPGGARHHENTRPTFNKGDSPDY